MDSQESQRCSFMTQQVEAGTNNIGTSAILLLKLLYYAELPTQGPCGDHVSVSRS